MVPSNGKITHADVDRLLSEIVPQMNNVKRTDEQTDRTVLVSSVEAMEARRRRMPLNSPLRRTFSTLEI